MGAVSASGGRPSGILVSSGDPLATICSGGVESCASVCAGPILASISAVFLVGSEQAQSNSRGSKPNNIIFSFTRSILQSRGIFRKLAPFKRLHREDLGIR